MFTISPTLMRQVVAMVENYEDYIVSPDGLGEQYSVYNYFDDGVYIVDCNGECVMAKATKLQKIDISATRQQIAKYCGKAVVVATYNDKALAYSVGYVTSPFCDYEFNNIPESEQAVASALYDLAAWVKQNSK